MRTKLDRNSFTNVTSTTVDTLVSLSGDALLYFVATGGPAPSSNDDGHPFRDDEAVVVPTGLDIYARALGNNVHLVHTAFGV